MLRLMKLWIAHITEHRVILCLVNNELERMWKDARILIWGIIQALPEISQENNENWGLIK
jgi:hypothetical protein